MLNLLDKNVSLCSCLKCMLLPILSLTTALSTLSLSELPFDLNLVPTPTCDCVTDGPIGLIVHSLFHSSLDAGNSYLFLCLPHGHVCVPVFCWPRWSSDYRCQDV